MEQNVGQTDKVVRIAVGAVAGVISLALLGNAVSGPMSLSPVLGVVSLVLLGTGLTSRCGLYSVLGINTCRAQ